MTLITALAWIVGTLGGIALGVMLLAGGGLVGMALLGAGLYKLVMACRGKPYEAPVDRFKNVGGVLVDLQAAGPDEAARVRQMRMDAAARGRRGRR